MIPNYSNVGLSSGCDSHLYSPHQIGGGGLRKMEKGIGEVIVK